MLFMFAWPVFASEVKQIEQQHFIIAYNSPVEPPQTLYKPLQRMESSEVALALSMVKEAGFDPLIAYKIIACESGGNRFARHLNTNGSIDLGLWQINSVHKIPDEDKTDIVKSTLYAIELMKSSRSYSHWTCFR